MHFYYEKGKIQIPLAVDFPAPFGLKISLPFTEFLRRENSLCYNKNEKVPTGQKIS